MALSLGALATRPSTALTRAFGLPDAVPLRRYRPGDPVVEGAAALRSACPGGRLAAPVRAALAEAGVPAVDEPGEDERLGAVLLDATGLTSSADLDGVYEALHPLVRRLRSSGRVLVLGDRPEDAPDVPAAVAARALEGLTRSLGKELSRGSTCQLVQVAADGADGLPGALRFLLSGRSAYISGQVLRIGPAATAAPDDPELPLDGRVALVTGAARGIGEAVAETLARDGATVVCLDVPAATGPLEAVAARIRGAALPADITAEGAAARIAERLRADHGGVDLVVNNAGITRDRTLGRMSRTEWDAVLNVNLRAAEAITAAVCAPGGDGGPVLRDGGALVCTASVSGIAGNRGQTNYGASKAGLIGLVQALAPQLAERGARINAVAPGFIETKMTSAMPLFVREAGRRMNSLGQGGLPADVAEAAAFLGGPAAAGITGQVLRVCGQQFLGA